ncbi:hypothetical protein [Actinacidiphila epipremni]|uniref:Antitoxin n=1 Tax=Actinacidiphila epipremni TaxID=2053013 RepID=A0ABX0ZGK1_9ACTN|nr:hypothetical protein [Actinacidiphila epipremni]NJP42257.1 hypothetical protein [Actinacidiphila epipremni]
MTEPDDDEFFDDIAALGSAATIASDTTLPDALRDGAADAAGDIVDKLKER